MSRSVGVSFEFFPPNDAVAGRQLWDALQRLAPLAPQFVSVTHGADGSSRSRTFEWVRHIRRETDLVVVPHLTCAGQSRADVLCLAQDYWREGIRHLVALRGDLAAGDSPAAPEPRNCAGFGFAADLVHGLKQTANFDITVAAYPEGHPETVSVDADIDNLKRKVAAGASRAITQFFFDADVFLRYRDRCRAAGIDVAIVPGILPITRFPQLLSFAGRCGATVPNWLCRRFDGLDNDADTRRLIAAHIAIEQVQLLRHHGVDEFHFYTLNQAELTLAICHALGVRADESGVQRRRFG